MSINLVTKDVIYYSAYETSVNGYIKRSDDEENCTANKIVEAILGKTVSQENLEAMKDRVAAWFEYLSLQSGEYFDDVKSSITSKTVREEKVGLIASSFASLDRFNSYKVQREAEKQSEYLGEEGDHVTFEVKEYRLLKTGTSKYKGSSSKWYLYKIRDTSGNSISLFANKNLDKNFQKCVHAEAIIQKLSEFNGIKQTQISNIRFIEK